MNRSLRTLKISFLIASYGALLTASGCLPANFWAELGGAAITAAVLQVLSTVVSGAIGA